LITEQRLTITWAHVEFTKKNAKLCLEEGRKHISLPESVLSDLVSDEINPEELLFAEYFTVQNLSQRIKRRGKRAGIDIVPTILRRIYHVQKNTLVLMDTSSKTMVE
jgi:hypothetical protein